MIILSDYNHQRQNLESMPMRPQSAKAKGGRLQQFVVHELLTKFPSLTEADVRSTSMGAGGEDVQLSSAAQRLFPYSIEAKNQERVNVWAALVQARSNAAKRTPLVVFKKNGEDPHVLLNWNHFIELATRSRGTTDASDVAARLRALADELDPVSNDEAS